MSEGRKDDQQKARFDLIAPEFLFGLASVLEFGSSKYEARNWELGMAWGRPFAALMRHMWAWWGGRTHTKYNFLLGELDGETGYSHLHHAACCLMFLVGYESRGIGVDDRFATKPVVSTSEFLDAMTKSFQPVLTTEPRNGPSNS